MSKNFLWDINFILNKTPSDCAYSEIIPTKFNELLLLFRRLYSTDSPVSF